MELHACYFKDLGAFSTDQRRASATAGKLEPGRLVSAIGLLIPQYRPGRTTKTPRLQGNLSRRSRSYGHSMGVNTPARKSALDGMEVPGPAGRDLARKLSWVAGAGEPGRWCLQLREVPVQRERTSVGLDVHARSVVACGIDASTGEMFRARLGPQPEAVLGWLRELPGPVAVAYEAGPTGYGLARFLTDHNIRCVVAAPSKLQRPSGDRVKTDAKDAQHLARLLRLDEITPVVVPTVAQEAARDLVGLHPRRRRSGTARRGDHRGERRAAQGAGHAGGRGTEHSSGVAPRPRHQQRQPAAAVPNPGSRGRPLPLAPPHRPATRGPG